VLADYEPRMRTFLCASLFASFVAAQPTMARPARLTPQLALAQICASEEGLEEITDGCAAIHQVLLRGAARRGMTYVAYARAYSSAVFEGTGRRPWLADLNPQGYEPARWPRAIVRRRRDGTNEVVSHPSWSVYRERWLELYAHAGRVVRGEVPAFCAEPPDHFGCPPDRARQCRDHEHAMQRGWTLTPCGDTRSEFWLVPGLD